MLQPDILEKINIDFNENNYLSYAIMPYKSKPSISLGLKGKDISYLYGELAHEIAEVILGPNEIHKKNIFSFFEKMFGKKLGRKIYYYLLLLNGEILKHEIEADKLAAKMIKAAGLKEPYVLIFLQGLYNNLSRVNSMKNFLLKRMLKERINYFQGLQI